MMRNGRRKFQKMKLISMALAAVTCLSLLSGITAPSAQAAESDDDMPIVLSLGDSYSSGEGCEPFYNQNDVYNGGVSEWSEDFLAHRSKNSWPGLLEFNGKKLNKYRDTGNWYFQAASGAETNHICDDEQHKSYRYLTQDNDGNIQWKKNSKDLNPQLDVVAENDLYGKIDYVTMTIGGNDIGFTSIIGVAALQPKSLFNYSLNARFAYAWAQYYKKGDFLENTYRKIANKVGDQATIIVAGYPPLISRLGSVLFFNS